MMKVGVIVVMITSYDDHDGGEGYVDYADADAAHYYNEGQGL